jgi:S-adenosylmethionine decarboxylase
MAEQPKLYSVDLSGCSALDSFDPPALSALFVSTLVAAGATVVHEARHEFPGVGLTCILILSESHAVLHSWPETGTVNIDIFSCSTRLRSLAAISELGRMLGARDISVQEIARADGREHHPARAGI